MNYEEICEQLIVMNESVLDELLDQTDTAYISEGTNLKFKKEYKSISKETKESIKKVKKLIKSGDAKGANDEIDRMIKIISDYKTYLKEYDDSIPEAICGWLLQTICTDVKATLIGIGTLGFGGPISIIKDWIDIIKGIVEQVKSDETIDVKTFNLRKNKIIGLLDGLIKKMKKMKAEVAVSGNSKPTAESVDDIKLSIYESERNGDIDEEQRKLLLEMVSYMD